LLQLVVQLVVDGYNKSTAQATFIDT